MCTRAEQHWRARDEYALRSMAQTRAIGRALRAPLGQIVVLAGYDPAGAEEISVDEQQPAPTGRGPIPDEIKPTGEQKQELARLIAELEQLEPDTHWRERCREIAGVPWEMVTATIADYVIEKLREEAP